MGYFIIISLKWYGIDLLLYFVIKWISLIKPLLYWNILQTIFVNLTKFVVAKRNTILTYAAVTINNFQKTIYQENL